MHNKPLTQTAPAGRMPAHSSLVNPAPGFSEGYSQGVRQAMMSSKGASGAGSCLSFPHVLFGGI